MADHEPRPPKLVIDQTIRENKIAAYVLYGFATTFVLLGVFVVVWGAVQNQGLVALAGSVQSALFYPAMASAQRLRRENVAIRLMEIPLSKAETAYEANNVITEFFARTLATPNGIILSGEHLQPAPDRGPDA